MQNIFSNSTRKISSQFLFFNLNWISIFLWTNCYRRNFRMQFNFVFFALLAESTKFSSTLKPRIIYQCVCDTALAVRKFIPYESSRTLEYEIFTCTKISAITVVGMKTVVHWWKALVHGGEHILLKISAVHLVGGIFLLIFANYTVPGLANKEWPLPRRFDFWT